MPCYKLNYDSKARHGEAVLGQRPARIYFRWLRKVRWHPVTELKKSLPREIEAISVADVVALYRGKNGSELLARALRAPLFGGWKEELLERHTKSARGRLGPRPVESPGSNRI